MKVAIVCFLLLVIAVQAQTLKCSDSNKAKVCAWFWTSKAGTYNCNLRIGQKGECSAAKNVAQSAGSPTNPCLLPYCSTHSITCSQPSTKKRDARGVNVTLMSVKEKTSMFKEFLRPLFLHSYSYKDVETGIEEIPPEMAEMNKRGVEENGKAKNSKLLNLADQWSAIYAACHNFIKIQDDDEEVDDDSLDSVELSARMLFGKISILYWVCGDLDGFKLAYKNGKVACGATSVAGESEWKFNCEPYVPST